jgi:hypothetical protein
MDSECLSVSVSDFGKVDVMRGRELKWRSIPVQPAMVATVTLQIPDAIYQRLEVNTKATQRSLEAVLLHALEVGSPPPWNDVPEEFQSDLASLDALIDDELWHLVRGQMPDALQDRYDRLLELNADGALSQSERDNLQALKKESDRFMLRKAQAAVLLKWRGHQVEMR